MKSKIMLGLSIFCLVVFGLSFLCFFAADNSCSEWGFALLLGSETRERYDAAILKAEKLMTASAWSMGISGLLGIPLFCLSLRRV